MRVPKFQLFLAVKTKTSGLLRTQQTPRVNTNPEGDSGSASFPGTGPNNKGRSSGGRLPDDASVAVQGRADLPAAVFPLVQVDPLVALEGNKGKQLPSNYISLKETTGQQMLPKYHEFMKHTDSG